jgi:formate hydrogenlyase subunit 4
VLSPVILQVSGARQIFTATFPTLPRALVKMRKMLNVSLFLLLFLGPWQVVEFSTDILPLIALLIHVLKVL